MTSPDQLLTGLNKCLDLSRMFTLHLIDSRVVVEQLLRIKKLCSKWGRLYSHSSSSPLAALSPKTILQPNTQYIVCQYITKYQKTSDSLHLSIYYLCTRHRGADHSMYSHMPWRHGSLSSSKPRQPLECNESKRNRMMFH